LAQPLDYQRALGRFTTGVTVVTATHEARRFAMTASALTSVSLDPILLLVCFNHDSATRVAVREAGHFGLSVLGEGGGAVAKHLATERADEVDQLDDFDMQVGPKNVPLLTDALVHCVCSVERIMRAGDHDVVVGAVEWIDRVREGERPLVFYDGAFWNLTPLDDETTRSDV
jgi:flavin reductase (DIM6/NTAB) family NADH-FMN oxidoreductase RutF